MFYSIYALNSRYDFKTEIVLGLVLKKEKVLDFCCESTAFGTK